MVTLTAANSKGSTSRKLKIAVGDRLGLTPQMGWNHWYTHLCHITEQNIRQAAESMIVSGMADYGYQYISIDDCWAVKPGSDDAMLNGPARDSSGAILPNKLLPDMKKLTGDIHAQGLKVGIYSSPGPLTCAGFEGSYGHEALDARQFSNWGFDLLKYDWCSYGSVAGGKSLDDLQKPYRKMDSILKGLDRDVVLNMCQYGMDEVWKWGREVGGNSWRTTNDLGLEKDDDLPGFYRIGFNNSMHGEYAGPGGWNDPDYIVIGRVGVAKGREAPIQLTRLTADEQYSYMSMWTLMAAPLFFSGDMAAVDGFTLNVLCNAEVIDVDQDSLGRQGHILQKTAQEYVLAKLLDDGSTAVGLFNLTREPLTISFKWSELSVTGRQRVRDIWRQRDLGTFKDGYSAVVPSHGVIMIRVIGK